MKIKVPKGTPFPDSLIVSFEDGGELLKRIRCEKCLTKHEMAERLGISFSYYVGLEDGDKNLAFNLFNDALQDLGFEIVIRRKKNDRHKIHRINL